MQDLLPLHTSGIAPHPHLCQQTLLLSFSYNTSSNPKLTLREMEWYKAPEVELLVLSACNTALGDEQAEMGFAGLAVQAGVKSALASLWKVRNVGTLGLMTVFYHHLKTQPIKAEALRQAQLDMLKGKVAVRDGQLHVPGMAEGVPLPQELAQELPKLEKKNLSHPYYWAAFTMIGSPW